jgi:hypothetical protein
MPTYTVTGTYKVRIYCTVEASSPEKAEKLVERVCVPRISYEGSLEFVIPDETENDDDFGDVYAEVGSWAAEDAGWEKIKATLWFDGDSNELTYTRG